MDTFRNPLDSDRREELLEFADRYERGTPYDDISEEEALSRYREVVPELSGEDYRRSAREAFSLMQPEERAELGKQLWDQSLQQGYDFPEPGADDGGEDHLRDPDYLTELTARMRREHPDLLEGLIGAGGAGLVGGMMGEGITGGEGVASGRRGKRGLRHRATGGPTLHDRARKPALKIPGPCSLFGPPLRDGATSWPGLEARYRALRLLARLYLRLEV